MIGKPMLRQSIRGFFKSWGAYVTLVIIMNVILSGLIVPLLEYATGLILRTNQVPYLSYTNVSWLLTQKPLAVIELIGLLLVLLALVFWQFAFLLYGIDNIAWHQNRSLWQVAGDAIRNLFRLRVGSFLFFLGYFILILPFSFAYLNSPLLAKVSIPIFILNDLEQNLWIAGLLGLLAVIAYYLGIRLIQVLPLMILSGQTGFAAAKKSWQMTRRKSWQYFWRLLVLGAINLLSTVLLSYGLYLIQTFLDKQSKEIALTGAVINMGVLTIWQRLVAAFSVVVFILMLTSVALNREHPSRPQRIGLSHRQKISRRVMATTLILLFLAGTAVFNVVYLQGSLLDKPLMISHRGVDDGNGVQNTIPALNKTSRERPDYVEMDIHETKDHQFVVMHDENLEKLAGVDAAPYQLTLTQLKRLVVHENGHSAHVASFDDYLSAAERDHQKLLVEIKTTSHDSHNMLSLFIHRYERRLLADHDRIHSLDYHVVSGLKKRAPKLFVSYILPYNFSFPETKANAYTVEETTLNEQFVDQAHSRHQQVDAWTVDDQDDMVRMLFINVDGIITDDLTQLKAVVNENFDHPSYAQRLLIYSNELAEESPN
ncbi:glycerophosphoryl diester phosphodiesterase [Lentilactobacillus fungorum]|uniref:Glycerophosphoryl diester phosphodiesterase n=1 Tax=Lentilactobacillus fungorum TaxID=2201250 RepID=A0ABQ3W0V9_9LACO|nr:glycerophosphoryl diester phosphodiesterase [Lentilactobacillus fungorum]